MAKTYPCDNGCGNVADVNLHFISTTDISWLCPGCFQGAMVALVTQLGDDVLLEHGLMKITAPRIVEDGSAPAPAERPQPGPDDDEDEDEGADGAPETREAGADAGDPGGADGVRPGGGDGAKPPPHPATA